MPNDELRARAEEWIAGDPDPATRSELLALIDGSEFDELDDRMHGTLHFGTAGLRGKVEAGSNRMNRAVVIRATAGVAAHLAATTDADRGPVVVGRDARLSSAQFMDDTIGVLVAAGFDVRFFAEPTPTPIVAFAAKRLGGCAAIVVTASHNPPADNGYKVYAANTAQIVPPTDVAIAEAIGNVGPANTVDRVEAPYEDPRVRRVPADLGDDYFAEVRAFLPVGSGRDATIVYTAMHGVGGTWVLDALERFGFRRVHPVAAQFAPDGRFPTVAFPNPEEPGALDLAHDLAEAVDADVVLANDPDTDRLAVSLPNPGAGWRQLSGNQIGVLLADFILTEGDVERPIVINSIVSSPMLGSIASQHDAVFAQTLTGFKWICNAAFDLEAEGKGSFAFGFEEALGYSVGPIVRDKDGISAAVAFATLVGATLADGRSVWDLLGELYLRHGLWVSTQKSIVRPGAEGTAEIAAVMESIATTPPTTLAGHVVTETTDYRVAADRRPRYLGETPLVELALGGNGRALVRPSGTEPKLKVYVDLRRDLDAVAGWGNQEISLLADADAVAEDLAAFLGFG